MMTTPAPADPGIPPVCPDGQHNIEPGEPLCFTCGVAVEQFILSWDMVRTQCMTMAQRVRQLHGLSGDVVGLHPLHGAEVPAAMVAGMADQPIVPWIGSGVILVGLVARRCTEAARWVDQLGEGLGGVLWAFRDEHAPMELATPTIDGYGPPVTFPVCGQQVAGADWLVMPWEVDNAYGAVTQVGP